VVDPYLRGEHRWWHLSGIPPELRTANDDGWLGPPGTVLDVGCGLGVELAYLSSQGWRSCGADLSMTAVQRAHAEHTAVSFVLADAVRLPFADHVFDLVLDRGCFHYLDPPQRHTYAGETTRVLRPGGRMLLRACLNSAGIRNDITEAVIVSTFAGWSIDSLKPVQLPSDTREMPALEARLRRPQCSR
jgi:SAM-dependent methyltransferase